MAYIKHSAVVVEDGAPRVENEQEGVATHAPSRQLVVERYLKQALAVVVIACGASVPFLSPTEDALALKACSIVVAIGAGLGITSSGNPPKRK